jgi:hypothetical protein
LVLKGTSDTNSCPAPVAATISSGLQRVEPLDELALLAHEPQHLVVLRLQPLRDLLDDEVARRGALRDGRLAVQRAQEVLQAEVLLVRQVGLLQVEAE